jgi:hypothetical protein
MADGQSDKAAPADLVAAALNKPTLGIAGMKTKLGGVLTSPALFADGKKNHEEPALHVSTAVFFPARTARELGDPAAVQTTNFGISIGLVPPLGANGTGADDVAMELGAKNVFNKSLSPSFVSPYGIELDLDAMSTTQLHTSRQRRLLVKTRRCLSLLPGPPLPPLLPHK